MGLADDREGDGVFAAAGFPARVQSFVQVDFPQGRGPFVPFMGFVDALMTVGWAGMPALVSPTP